MEERGGDAWGIGRVSYTFLSGKERRSAGTNCALFLCRVCFVCLCMCSRMVVLVARRRRGV